MRVRIHYHSRRIAEEFGRKAKGHVNVEIDDLFETATRKQVNRMVNAVIEERFPWIKGAVQNIERLER